VGEAGGVWLTRGGPDFGRGTFFCRSGGTKKLFAKPKIFGGLDPEKLFFRANPAWILGRGGGTVFVIGGVSGVFFLGVGRKIRAGRGAGRANRLSPQKVGGVRNPNGWGGAVFFPRGYGVGGGGGGGGGGGTERRAYGVGWGCGGGGSCLGWGGLGSSLFFFIVFFKKPRR